MYIHISLAIQTTTPWYTDVVFWTYQDIVSNGEGGAITTKSTLKVPCAPKSFDLEFPIIKTTKLSVEKRSGTRAERSYLKRFMRSCRAPFNY